MQDSYIARDCTKYGTKNKNILTWKNREHISMYQNTRVFFVVAINIVYVNTVRIFRHLGFI